jgi:hypothetical protein
MIVVWDAVAAPPAPRAAGAGDEQGRGLAIGTALSARWDFYLPPPPAGGKVTWAVIDHPWRDQPPGQ